MTTGGNIPSMRYSTLIFDLDGTLSDPLPGMAASINHAFELAGFDTVSADSLAAYVGPPLENTVRQLTGLNDEASILELIRHYREHYVVTGYKMNTLYDGVAELLDELDADGVRVGVCTSKPEKTARLILDYFGLEPRFAFISGGDVGVRKAEQLKALLASAQIDNTALMIGDRAVDIESAQENQLASAAVHWGFGVQGELHTAKPTHHVQTPAALSALRPVSSRGLPRT